MDTENLKKKAAELGDKAQEFIHRPELQDAISKGKDLLERGRTNSKISSRTRPTAKVSSGSAKKKRLRNSASPFST